MANDLEHDDLDPGSRAETNLTPEQLLFWVGQKHRPESPIHNLPFVFQFSRAISVERFQRAFQVLFDASDTLRTVIEERHDVPFATVRPRCKLEVPVVELTGDAQLKAWVQKRCRCPIPFTGWLFETALIRWAPGRYAWYFNQHHIVKDTTSVALIYRHLSNLYSKTTADSTPGPPVIPRFSSVRAQPPRDSAADEYWARKTETPPDGVSFYGSAAQRSSTRASRLTLELGASRSERLRAFATELSPSARNAHAAKFTVLMTVLVAYLYRMGGGRRLMVNTSFQHRPSPESREALGLFVQTLPLAVDVDRGDTFLTLGKKVTADLAEMRRHRPYSLPPGRHTPEIALNHQVATFPDFAGIPVRLERPHPGHGEKDLVLHADDFSGSGELTIHFDLHEDCFAPEDRSRVPEHYLRLLDACLENPGQCVGDAELLSSGERRHLLVELQGRETGAPVHRTIVEHFEQRVRVTPDREALVFPALDSDQAPSKSLTFRELNARANQLARHLRRDGVGTETLVGLCLERGPAFVVGILAVLKAGGAYVPLDPAYPADRLAFMIKDAGMPLILADAGAEFPGFEGRLIDVASDWDRFASEDDSDLGAHAGAENLAYVIYTSGSTGQPKGVSVPHRGLCNLIESGIRLLDVTTDSRFVHALSFNFDAATAVLFTALCGGATTYLARENSPLDRILRERRITHAPLPVAAWAALPKQDLPDLRLISAGGEPCPTELANTWAPGRRFLNVYGPTETTSRATAAEYVPGGDALTIGVPIENVRTYILDENGRLLPQGVPGELYIGGMGVARGYLNRPALTAERFVPDPFSEVPGARIYRTGDLARHRADGQIEFLGRLDDQVKIRGYRVELGEVEAVLNTHPSVGHSRVIAVDDETARTGTGKALVAYMMPNPGGEISSREVRGFLESRLPRYMVPAAYMVLEVFPLTPNGKVDVRALPPPVWGPQGSGREIDLPRTPTEATLVELWREVLGLEAVGVQDNFMDLGGHSLTAFRVVRDIEERFGVAVPLALIFGAGTIEDLGRVVDGVIGGVA